VNERETVIVDPSPRRMEEIFSATDLQRLRSLAAVAWGRNDPMPADEFRDSLRGAVAVVCNDWRYGDVLANADALRGILTVSGGWPEALDYELCFRRDVRVLSAAPAFAPAVAEMALGLALACSRDIVSTDRAMRSGTERWRHGGNANSFLLFDRAVGCVGFGAIGRSLRTLLAPFGCAIRAYDPWRTDGDLRAQGVEPSGLEDLLESSDVIFVLAAPTADNAGMLSREALEHVRPGAVLVLVSRAHVVDFDALTEFVLAGRFKAAIDVFPSEPLDRHHPIRDAQNAVLSAHRAGSVRDALLEIGRMVVDDLEAILHGLPPQQLQRAEPELVARRRLASQPGHEAVSL
jgi:phosphoglycerate dehydrogenase-like enzyme